MQSISDNWGKRYRGDEAVLESDLGRDGGGPSILDGAPDAARSPEEELEYKQHVEAIRRSFADDPVLMRIVLDLEEGAKFPEIREQQGLGENEMHAAIRRLRRRLARQAEKVFHA